VRQELSGQPAHQDKHHDKSGRFVRRFDKDSDGKLQVSELPADMRQWLAGADTNKDGVLSQEELKAHKHKLHQAHFAKMDKNNDSVITADEVDERHWQFISKADANTDQKVTQDELKAHKQKMHDEHFAKMDKNTDGALAADEVDERHWQFIAKADVDANNKVTKEELHKAFEEGKLGFKGRGHHGGGHHDPAQWAAKFDQNKNGTLELSELPPHKRDHMSAADTDKNGALSQEEIKAHFEARRKMHEEGR